MSTRKDLYEMAHVVYQVGYADLQNNLSFFNKIGHNAGVYGWNWNAYLIEANDFGRTIVINTGYRNTTGIRIPFKIVRKYEAEAEKIIRSAYKYTEQIKRIKKNIIKMIEETDRYYTIKGGK